ncbi:hypothetical protein AAG906_031558 [Vitis piasezkii]
MPWQTPKIQTTKTQIAKTQTSPAQIDQIATVLEQITHRLDVMDERYAERNMGPSIGEARAIRDGERLGESDGDLLMYWIFGKLEPNAFEDRLTAIEDYFDWFDVSEDRKVRYVRMKLKGMHEHGGEVWKNNSRTGDQQFLAGRNERAIKGKIFAY